MRAGVDLGGTKVQAVIVDREDSVIGRARRPTPTAGGPEAVTAEIARAVAEAATDAGVEIASLDGVGIGSPGVVDSEAGTVAQAGNLAGWEGTFPLAAALGETLGVPAGVANDVTVAVEAELALGAGRPYSSLVGVFWGTGVGAGVVLDGRTWLGRGAAGELGHMVVRKDGARCPCGRRGCVEAYAGRGAMEARARRLVEQNGRKTKLFDIMRHDRRTRLTSGVWSKALDRGDQLARELVDRAVEALGAGIASAVNLLDVQAVVIGGGLGTRLGEPYVQRIGQAMMPHLFVDFRPPALHVASLGDLGGAVGAALLVEKLTPADVAPTGR